jgi:Sulfotransferase family
VVAYRGGSAEAARHHLLTLESESARAPAPFIVGVPRSGTTLLRLMLDAHPELTIPPETHFLPRVIRACRQRASPERVVRVVARHRRWEDFGIEPEQYLARLREIEPLEAGPAIRAFYELYAERAGKPRWGDKTPGYAIKMRRIQRALPEARFIHLIRDGRDVVLSRESKTRRPLPVDVAAKRWKRRVMATRNRSEGVAYTELRYEALVTDPEASLRQVCELIELPFDPAMLDYHEGAEERLSEIDRELPASRGHERLEAGPRLAAHGRVSQPPSAERIGAWRSEMPPADQAAFEEVAGDLLAELGYEPA